jgi:hypothetical protein
LINKATKTKTKHQQAEPPLLFAALRDMADIFVLRRYRPLGLEPKQRG